MQKKYVKGKAVKLSKNFKSTEFDCRCKRSDCKVTLVDEDMLQCIQRVRDAVGKAIVVNSGYRCDAHNKSVGGASGSKHKSGLAVDLKCPKDIKLNDFAFICEQAGFHGVLRYDGQGFVHCDMRDGIYYGITTDNGKTFKKVDTFDLKLQPKKVDVMLLILKNGSKGESVKALQILLNGYGFKGKNGKVLTVDGIFGGNCEYALKNFQKTKGLTQNGKTDGDTLKALLGVAK